MSLNITTNTDTDTDTDTDICHLLTEDNETNRYIIKLLLEKNGILVEDTDSGKKTCDKVKNNINKFSNIWLELDMPKMDGITCAQKLRNDLHYKNSIIGITSHVDQELFKECRIAGINDVVTKPVTEDVLKKYINKHT